MNLNFTAPINPLSYGYTSYYVLKELSQLLDVCLFPIGQPVVPAGYNVYYVESAIQRALNFDNNAPSLRLWHQFDLVHHVGKGPKIGFPIFELDNFRDIELTHLRAQDYIFVPSAWAKKVILNKIPSAKVHVVPLGVDKDIFKPASLLKGDTTVFLNVGKLEVRKGHADLLECFNKAFEPKDNVELWLATYNVHMSPEDNESWAKQCKATKLGDKIQFFGRMDTQQQLAQLMNQADVGVFPSKAEGWNLPLLEMMACGKPVIATDYSAHTEFCDPFNCALIPIDATEVANDGKWFHGFGNWAKFGAQQKETLITYLRSYYNSKQLGNELINYNGIETAANFSWNRTADTIFDFLSTI